ncbi:MAG: O-antigen ligase family protein [Phycisphaerales bacterium]|nr:O-antigen ligase family protein [Phycisphaerales bacterium]
MWLPLAFLSWAALSLAWTPDVEAGLENLRAMRYLLLIPALVPVLESLRWCMLAILATVGVQLVFQVLGFFHMDAWKFNWYYLPQGGLSAHPGPAGAWALIALSVCFCGGLGLKSWLRGVAALVAIGGLGLSGARSAFGALVLWCMGSAGVSRGPHRVIVRSALLGLIGAAVIAMSTLPGPIPSKARAGIASAWAILTDQPLEDLSLERRRLLQRAALSTGLAHPLTGAGLGAAEGALSEMTSREPFLDPKTDRRGNNIWQGDFHSAWAESFAELGIPGFLLFVAPVLLSIWIALTYMWGRPPPEHDWGPLVLAAALTSLVFGMFTVVYSSGQMQAMAMFAMTLAIGASTGLFQLDAEPERPA